MKPLQLVLRYTRNYTWQLAVTVTSMLLLVVVQLTLPWIIKTLIDIVTDPSADPDSWQMITTLTFAALGIFLMRGFLQFARSYVAHIAGWGVVANLRKHLYQHLQRLSLRFYEDKQTGQLMSQVVNDSDLFETLIAHAIPDVFVNVLTLIGVIFVLGSINWGLLLLSLVPVPLMLVSLRFYAKRVRPAFRFRQKELGDLNALLNENIAGIREIKAFTREEAESDRIGKRIDNYKDIFSTPDHPGQCRHCRFGRLHDFVCQSRTADALVRIYTGLASTGTATVYPAGPGNRAGHGHLDGCTQCKVP